MRKVIGKWTVAGWMGFLEREKEWLVGVVFLGGWGSDGAQW